MPVPCNSKCGKNAILKVESVKFILYSFDCFINLTNCSPFYVYIYCSDPKQEMHFARHVFSRHSKMKFIQRFNRQISSKVAIEWQLQLVVAKIQLCWRMF